MFIVHIIISIIIFISPFIIFLFFKLNNFKGYLQGVLCFLSSLLSLIGFLIIAIIIVAILLYIKNPNETILMIPILIILSYLGNIILNYIFHHIFIKQIINESTNEIILMYISGFDSLVQGTSSLLNAFTKKNTQDTSKKNLPESLNKMLTLFDDYLGYAYEFLNSGICICIFFYYKKNSNRLKYISIFLYFGFAIFPFIGVLLNSMIICSMFILVSIISFYYWDLFI